MSAKPIRRLEPSSRALATVFTLLVFGCQDEGLPHLGKLQYDGEDFEVWASDGLQACGGTFAYTESWLLAFRQRIGGHGHPGRHTFYWLTEEDLGTDHCPESSACAYPDPNIIYSTSIPYEHEIVHTQLDARPPSIFVEGAAEVFGSIKSPYTTEVIDLEPLLEDEQIPSFGSYQTAGRFSRFIIERHGLDAYFALFEELDASRGREAIAEGVRRTLDVELDMLVANFESSSPCSVARWRYFDHECSSLALTPWLGPTRWVEEIDLSCSAVDVIGPRGGLIWTLRALEVEHEGSYQLSIESADATARVDVLPCNVDCFDERATATPTASVTTGGRATIFLTAGRHWMRVEHSDASDAGVTVSIEP